MRFHRVTIKAFLRGTVVGMVLGGGVAGYFGFRTALRAQRDTDVACAGIAAEVLASLRTGDAPSAEQYLEAQIDLGVQQAKMQSISSPAASFLFGPLSTDNVKGLSWIKYYRNAFPSTLPGHRATEQFLATIPDIDVQPDPHCRSGFCRIAERRQGKAK